MGLNAHGFDPVVLALDAPALALDLPGHGRSDWREDANYRPDLLAADVLTALRNAHVSYAFLETTPEWMAPYVTSIGTTDGYTLLRFAD